MLKQIRIILSVIIILCLTFLISSCPYASRYYVALGDSVSAGYGLTSNDESYPAILYNLLKKDGYANNYENMSVNGYTTTMLLEQLNNLDNEEMRILGNAQIITLNIGGNNLVVPFFNYLSKYKITYGIDEIRPRIESIIRNALNLIYGVRSRGQIFNPNPDLSRAIINDIVSRINAVIERYGNEEVTSNLKAISSILKGSFSAELNYELEKGVNAFTNEFKDIIIWLKINAPKATIIVNTVYNPIPQEILGESLEIYSITNKLIESMNNIIILESQSSGFNVTDTYNYLSSELDMMIFNLNPYEGNLSLDLIHPNADGHKRIAELNYEVFKQR